MCKHGANVILCKGGLDPIVTKDSLVGSVEQPSVKLRVKDGRLGKLFPVRGVHGAVLPQAPPFLGQQSAT